MWEDLKVYKQLDKKDINLTFKKFGKALLPDLTDYSLDQTNSVIKLSRQINQLEQAVFIEKSSGSYDLQVRTSIKPIDFYRRNKFTMLNIVPLGDIMNNYRGTFYPLTQEWNDLAIFLTARIKNEIECYFKEFDSYEKIIRKRKEIEPKGLDFNNKYELLIYAALKTKDKCLLSFYLDKKMSRPTMQITKSEYLKLDNNEVNEGELLQNLKSLAATSDFAGIEEEIARAIKFE